jgi:hypothetical protein
MMRPKLIFDDARDRRTYAVLSLVCLLAGLAIGLPIWAVGIAAVPLILNAIFRPSRKSLAGFRGRELGS